MCTNLFFSSMLAFPCPLILLISHTLFFIVNYSCVHSKTCNLSLLFPIHAQSPLLVINSHAEIKLCFMSWI
ncbi:hypothetical protein BDB00DRAFT_818297 [Zychaea mexicana]|uniref:uncharacterized protein n=1 Tax=Zychaea mexicana TaxID=64656 RepID=UPI0022FE88DD|nr:uncharacterized protein BDB00DRAFT_818297 [Zychaea mexicana]KAI9494494.1 hypothetical protein BDB00DRAFT_818297 [Zychaea mexicana]